MLRCSKIDSSEGAREESPRLCFKSPQDAIDFADDLVKDSIKRMSINARNSVERYKEGEIELVVNLRVCASREQYHLVFCAVPRVGKRHLPEAIDRVRTDAGFISHGCARDWRERYVLVPSTYFGSEREFDGWAIFRQLS